MEKQTTEFYREQRNKDGLMNFCKVCRDHGTAQWRQVKRAEYNEYARQYRKTHPAKYERERNRAMRNRYGIDSKKYKEMLAVQGGVCAICKSPPKNDKPLYVDHHHKTGKIRKLLCASCNRSIAIFDNEALFLVAQEYINSHKD